MIQIWVLPEKSGEPAGYKLYKPERGNVIRVYGGPVDQEETFASKTIVQIALLNAGQKSEIEGPVLGYITLGKGRCNGEVILTDGDMFQCEDMNFKAESEMQLILINS